MSDDLKPNDPRAVWRDQPREKLEMNLKQFVNRRTQELYHRTRLDIIASVAAALFFVVIMWWRFSSTSTPLQLVGYVVVIAWVLVTLYWFRDRIWRRDAPPIDALAATGLEYYRKELERRRNHLKNAWIWHGPLFLACMVFILTFIGLKPQRLKNALPFLILLALWTAIDITRRRRQVRAIGQELAELEPARD